jgi:hypothetical protein
MEFGFSMNAHDCLEEEPDVPNRNDGHCDQFGESWDEISICFSRGMALPKCG